MSNPSTSRHDASRRRSAIPPLVFMAATMAACAVGAPGTGGETEGPTAASLDHDPPPATVVLRAEEHISGFRGFEGTTVAAWHPMFDPQGGVAYWEAELSRDGAPGGWVILGADRRDRPLVEFSPAGKSHHQRFVDSMKGKPFRMMRFGTGWVAAVDERDELLDSIGQQPSLFPEHCSQPGATEVRVKDGVKVTDTGQRARPPECQAAPVSSFAELKQQYHRFQAPKANQRLQQRITEGWDALEAKVLSPKPATPKPTLLGPTAGRVYAYSFANGYDYSAAIAKPTSTAGQNITYFLQIPAHVGVNTTDNWSGCGPNAWSNLYGWWDLHGRPGAIQGPFKLNSKPYSAWTDSCGIEHYRAWTPSVVQDMEMTLNDELFVHGVDWNCTGYTYHWDVWQGLNYATDVLHYDPSYWYRYGDIDSDWQVAVAQDALTRGYPVVVDYVSDSHISVAYGLAWQMNPTTYPQDNWLWVNPHNAPDESESKWISQWDPAGYFELDGLAQVSDGGFESDADSSAAPGFPTDSTYPWDHYGSAGFIIEDGGYAHSGTNNVLISGQFGAAGYSGLNQTVRVEPYRRYNMVAYVWGGAIPAGSWAHVGVKAPDGTALAYSTVTPSSGYVKYSWTFSTGANTSVIPYVKMYSDGTTNYGRWLRVDDINLYIADNVEDGDFEMTPGPTVSFPWEAKFETASGGSSSIVGPTSAPSGQQYANLSAPACGRCVSNSAVLDQLVSLTPNASPGTLNYRITARVRTNGPPVMMGVTAPYNTFPISGDFSGTHPKVKWFYPTANTWTTITIDIDNADWSTLRLIVGSSTTTSSASVDVDNVVMTPL